VHSNRKYIACILCTKDRPNFVLDFLDNLKKQTCFPDLLLIVDSSLNDLTREIVENHALNLNLEIFFYKSKSGLPRQRNFGIAKLLEFEVSPIDYTVAFLDDDVVIDENYFEILKKELGNNYLFAGITGQPAEDKVKRIGSILSRFFLLDSSKNGHILTSGIATVPRAKSSVQKVDWMCGLSMNIPLRILVDTKFDESIRMYCEDVEMSLRLQKYGPILCCPELRYQHAHAIEARQNNFKITTFTAGMRWELSNRHPGIINKQSILWSIIGQCVIDILQLIFLKKPKEKGQRLLGNADFILKIIFRKEVTERYK
jgi:GT2 family glycosyltransferase